jgi:chromosome segregation ATPase
MEILLIIIITLLFTILLVIFGLFYINQNKNKDNIKIIENEINNLNKKHIQLKNKLKKQEKEIKDKNKNIKTLTSEIEDIQNKDEIEHIDEDHHNQEDQDHHEQETTNTYNLYITDTNSDITERPYYKDIESINRKIYELNNNVETTQQHINNNFMINKNAKVYNNIRLCNNNEDCLLMSIDQNGDYNIKSENLRNIKLLNSDNRIIGKLSNDGIYFGGDNKDNSPLYINDNVVNAKIMKIGNLLINNADNDNMIDINRYIKSNNEYIEEIQKEYSDQNAARIIEITGLGSKINTIETDISQNIIPKFSSIETNINNIDNKSEKNIDDIQNIQTIQNEMIENDRYFRRYSDIYEDITDIPSHSEYIEENRKNIEDNRNSIDSILASISRQ